MTGVSLSKRLRLSYACANRRGNSLPPPHLKRSLRYCCAQVTRLGLEAAAPPRHAAWLGRAVEFAGCDDDRARDYGLADHEPEHRWCGVFVDVDALNVSSAWTTNQ